MMIWALAAFGVLAGCVVAMVSHRLPIALRREWRMDACDYLGVPFTPAPGDEFKASSGLGETRRLLAICGLCGVAGGLVAYLMGPSLQAVVYAALFWSLIAIAVIDIETLYIPDLIVLPLAWAGLLFFALLEPDQLQGHVLGAAAGYCALRWLPVGRGDAKLCAAAGAWLGINALLMFLTISATLSVVVGVAYYLVRGKSEPCPFGPSLVTGLIVTHILQSLNIQWAQVVV